MLAIPATKTVESWAVYGKKSFLSKESDTLRSVEFCAFVYLKNEHKAAN